MWQGVQRVGKWIANEIHKQTAKEKKRQATERSDTKKRGRVSHCTEAKLNLHTKSKPGHSYIVLKGVSCPRFSFAGLLKYLKRGKMRVICLG